ncbi:MAG: hypothetical protein ACOC33_01280 [bacterium]
MDLKIQKILGELQNQNSTNIDFGNKLLLSQNQKQIPISDFRSFVNIAQYFDGERQSTTKYRIYGQIQYFSSLNMIIKDYLEVKDFFTTPKLNDFIEDNNYKNFMDDFDVFLCKPVSGDSLSNNNKIRNFEIITKSNNFVRFNCAYSKNMFYEKVYLFNFNKTIDVEDLLDEFGKPITDLYLYFKYKPDLSKNEKLFESYFYIFNSFREITNNFYESGDTVLGDLIEYVPSNFEETNVSRQKYKIIVEYLDGMTTKNLEYFYYPFHPIKIRSYQSEITRANTISGDTNLNIPFYAVPIDDFGNVIWKNLLDIGYIEPISNKGVNYPYINGHHYVYNNIILDLYPNTGHNNTNNVYNEIIFPDFDEINASPINGSIQNLNQKC